MSKSILGLDIILILYFIHNRHSHVLDGAAEGVCDAAVVDGFLTQAKVSEFNVALLRESFRVI